MHPYHDKLFYHKLTSDEADVMISYDMRFQLKKKFSPLNSLKADVMISDKNVDY